MTLTSSQYGSHPNLLKRFTLFDLVSAPKITRAAGFCSLRILVKLSAEQFHQIDGPLLLV